MQTSDLNKYRKSLYTFARDMLGMPSDERLKLLLERKFESDIRFIVVVAHRTNSKEDTFMHFAEAARKVGWVDQQFRIKRNFMQMNTDIKNVVDNYTLYIGRLGRWL